MRSKSPLIPTLWEIFLGEENAPVYKWSPLLNLKLYISAKRKAVLFPIDPFYAHATKCLQFVLLLSASSPSAIVIISFGCCLCKINCAAASNRISRKGKQLGFIFFLSLMTQLAWVHYNFSEPKSCFPHIFSPPSPCDRQGFPSLSFLLCWVTFCAASLPLLPRKTLTDMTRWDHLYKFSTHALHSIERDDVSLYEGSAEGKEENKWEYLKEGKMTVPWAKYWYPLTVVENAS